MGDFEAVKVGHVFSDSAGGDLLGPSGGSPFLVNLGGSVGLSKGGSASVSRQGEADGCQGQSEQADDLAGNFGRHSLNQDLTMIAQNF